MIRTKPAQKNQSQVQGKEEKFGGYMRQPPNCKRKPIMCENIKLVDLCVCTYYCVGQCKPFKDHVKELKKKMKPPTGLKISQQKNGWRDTVKKEKNK